MVILMEASIAMAVFEAQIVIPFTVELMERDPFTLSSVTGEVATVTTHWSTATRFVG